MSLLRKRYALTAAAAIVAMLAAGHLVPRTSAVAAVDASPPAARLVAVDVATVVDRRIIDWHEYSGRLEAVDRVEVRPLVSGTLTEVHFKDGSLVRKGDVLFTIDPRPYAAALAHAEARLAAAQARQAYTASDLARARRLLAENAVARRDFEEKQNAAREAAANLQAGRAAVESARLDLEYTRITAPVSGRISRARLTVGNVVSAGVASEPLTTLVSVARMYAAFDVDEQSFLKYVNPALAQGAPVAVELGLANEDGYPRKGALGSVDNRLDVSSGTIRIRAVFDNADGTLVPGLYARVRLGAGAPRDAVLVDEKAIGTDQDKRFVLVLDPAGRAVYRQVRTGASHVGLRVIESGLAAGERIVVNGLQRVRPGETVQPHDVSMGAAS